jgi:hypothetical protein
MGIWQAIGRSDEWFTPRYIFEALGEEFDVDVAAAPSGCGYVPAKAFIRDLALLSRWHGFVWMNPPFGGVNNVVEWIERFLLHRNGIALLPDQTSARWFQRLAKRSDGILFVSPRVRFEKPDGTLGDSPANGTALFALGERGAAALLRARRLGIVMKPCKGGR